MRSTTEEIAGALDGAVDILRFEGWVQGAFRAPVSLENEQILGYCALGALAKVVGGQELLDKIISGDLANDLRVYRDTVSILGLAVDSAVDQWNDAPGRTKEEVIETMEKLSKDLRNGAWSDF